MMNSWNKLAGGYQIPHEMYQNDWFKPALKTLKKSLAASGVAPTCLSFNYSIYNLGSDAGQTGSHGNLVESHMLFFFFSPF